MENDILSSDFLDFSVYPFRSTEDVLKNCTGRNQKKLLVVFDAKDETLEQKEFLKKILQAAQFDFENDIILLSLTDKATFSFISFRTKIKDRLGDIDNLLAFGFDPTFFGLNINIKPYEPCHFYNCGFLFADALSTLENDKKLKGALWKGMQQLFSLG
ncbi:MAG: hypothetical protein AAF573_04015 [Bacteroidota bacterium]